VAGRFIPISNFCLPNFYGIGIRKWYDIKIKKPANTYKFYFDHKLLGKYVDKGTGPK